MTRDNQLENMRLELDRSRGALNSARILFEQGEHADSISRAYYAMLHSARALLLIEELEPKSHGGVAHYLNLRFVRKGLFPAAQARHLTRMQAERESADYDRAAVFERETAEDVWASASSFCETFRRVLGTQGYGV